MASTLPTIPEGVAFTADNPPALIHQSSSSYTDTIDYDKENIFANLEKRETINVTPENIEIAYYNNNIFSFMQQLYLRSVKLSSKKKYLNINDIPDELFHTKINILDSHVNCDTTISANAEYYNSILMLNVVINIFNEFRDILHVVSKKDETHAFVHFIRSIFIMSSINVGEGNCHFDENGLLNDTFMMSIIATSLTYFFTIKTQYKGAYLLFKPTTYYTMNIDIISQIIASMKEELDEYKKIVPTTSYRAGSSNSKNNTKTNNKNVNTKYIFSN